MKKLKIINYKMKKVLDMGITILYTWDKQGKTNQV